MRHFLLDTGLVLGIIRDAPWASRVREEFNLDAPSSTASISVISVGELLALSKKLGWGKTKQKKLEEILDLLPRIPIDHPSILESYAQIYAWTHGSLLRSYPQKSPPRPAVPMGQNDLWIAATAHALELTLLSTDKDFSHLGKMAWFPYEYISQET